MVKKHCTYDDKTGNGMSGCFKVELQRRLQQSTLRGKLELQTENIVLETALYIACVGLQDHVGYNMTPEQIEALIESYIAAAKKECGND
ncbi:MAG: hypothetical protein WCP79_06885 [Bacillota bacterium]